MKKTQRENRGIILLAPLIWGAVLSGQAVAEDGEGKSEEFQLDEIVVTARKKSENLQDVPISVSAFDSRSIETFGFTGSLGIADQVPNLEIKTFGGVPNIFIRGVGNNDFNITTVSPVSMYADGVLKGLGAGQFMQTYDMERIEVLRGPQGTLFGRNATGGALTFFSRKPGEENEGFVRIGFGNYGGHEIEAAGTIVLAPGKLATRVSGKLIKHDGDKTNLFDGERKNAIDLGSARAITRYTPTENSEYLWKIYGGRDRSGYIQGKHEGVIGGADVVGYSDPAPGAIDLVNINGRSVHHADVWGTSLTATWDLENITLKSVTAFEDVKSEYCADVDQSPNSLDEVCFLSDGDQFSQEVTVTSHTDGPLSWIAGAYYLHENLSYQTFLNLFHDIPSVALPLDSLSTRSTETMAVFGEMTYELTDRLNITAGLRYTYEKKEATLVSNLVFGLYDPGVPNAAPFALIPQTALSDSWNAVSGRLMVQYDLTEDQMIYASVSRGFKSGGFNLGAFFDPNEVSTVEPEFLNAYEIGLKSMSFNRRLKANVSAFLYDYSNLQVFNFTQGSSPALPIVIALENAADAKIYGAELEIQALPLDGLNLSLGLGYLHTAYKNFVSIVNGDVSGNSLPGAPKWNLNMAAQYEFFLSDEVSLTPRMEYIYTSQRFFDTTQSQAISSRGSHQLVNARLSLGPTDEAWKIVFWAKNLFNEEYIIDATDLSGTLGFIPLYYGNLRTYGAEVVLRF